MGRIGSCMRNHLRVSHLRNHHWHLRNHHWYHICPLGDSSLRFCVKSRRKQVAVAPFISVCHELDLEASWNIQSRQLISGKTSPCMHACNLADTSRFVYGLACAALDTGFIFRNAQDALMRIDAPDCLQPWPALLPTADRQLLIVVNTAWNARESESFSAYNTLY